MRKFSFAVLICMVAVIVADDANAQGKRRFITIGTGGPTGVYFVVGQSICRMVGREAGEGRKKGRKHGLRCAASSSDGSIYNIKKIRDGKFEFGLAQSDWQYHAYNGTSRFKDKRCDKLRAVFKRTSLIGANLRNVRLSKGTRNVNFRGANLDGADLSEATLQRADFQGASLVEASLIGAYLVAGKLDGARLMRAKLDGIKLVTANLEGADLSNASLANARLGFSNFAGARLFGADLRNADFIGAELRGADLRNAKGLTREQLDSACGDADTKLPEYLGNYEMNRCQEEGR